MAVISRVVVALVALCISQSALAGIFISTGHTGAQVQCDINHTQHWTYSVSQDVSDIYGGLFTMKRGSQTTSLVTLVIFEGSYADYGTVANLLSVTLGPGDFTQSFSPIAFIGTSISLFAGHVYTAVLSSDAGDSQNHAYFIKGGSDVPLGFVDENGDPTGDGSTIVPPAPAPGALMLFALAGIGVRTRRRCQ